MVRAGKDHMDRTKALATAAALALTVTGGVSALFLTVGAGDSPPAATASTEVVEYVDAAGNPLPAAAAGVASTPAATPSDAPTYAGEAETEEHEEEEHEEEHEEEEEEHEDGEHEDGEHEDGEHEEEEEHDDD
jgi:type IV secretory pathway VirB10-like protein